MLAGKMMAETTSPITVSDSRQRLWEDRLAAPMLVLTLAFLMTLAGLLHRFPKLPAGDSEAYLILSALGVLWLIFGAEAAFRYRLWKPLKPSWKALAGGWFVGSFHPCSCAA
jgi:hypothetical protein